MVNPFALVPPNIDDYDFLTKGYKKEFDSSSEEEDDSQDTKGKY